MGIEIGDTLGDYRVVGVLGRGGMGKVFRVRNRLTEREEAMKVVLEDLNENPTFLERFLREIKVHASLQHPNIAQLYSAQRIGDTLVMILELVEGVSLEDLLRPEGLDVQQSIACVNQVLFALAYAHDHGVVHRDIKPANILIGPGGVVKLTDFGIARSSSGAQLTGTGMAIGTMAYMSPEQISGGSVDGRSDIYSLGLTFYQMVTGRRAVDRDTEPERMYAQLALMPPAPETVNPRISAAISAAILRAIAKRPEDRFQSAREFQTALSHPEPADLPRPADFAAPAELRTPTRPAPIDPRDLTALETRLSRAIGPIAKRMVADAAGRFSAIEEIEQALSAQLQNPKEREIFSAKSPTTSKGAPISGATNLQTEPQTAQASPFDTATLDRVAQSLASFLGPIAKVVVNRAARTARSTEELRCTVAADIDSPADRQRFLESTRNLE